MKNNFKWSALERFGTQIIQFLILIILSRLLSPEDFGLIALLNIFIAISQVFIDGGLSSALIRKKTITEDDYSTAFLFNIFIGILFYLFIYLLSPYIATFFNDEKLILISRVLSLNLIITSFSVVYRARYVINFNFKEQAFCSLVGALFGGVCALIYCIIDLSVWAIVVQIIITNLSTFVLFLIRSRWVPKIKLDIRNLKDMINYGYKLIFISLLDVGFKNIYAPLIGKYNNTIITGYFSQANRLPEIIASTFTSIVCKVNFPSMVQCNREEIAHLMNKTVKLSMFIYIPIVMFIFVFSLDIVKFVFGNKWIAISDYLSVLSLASIYIPIQGVISNYFQVIGKSDILLKVELIKKSIAILLLLITIRFDVIYVCYGIVLSSFFNIYINKYFLDKEVGNCDYIYTHVIKYLFVSLLLLYLIKIFVYSNVLCFAIAFAFVYYVLACFIFIDNLKELKIINILNVR